MIFFFQAEDGIRDLVRSRGLGDVYKRQGERDGDQRRDAGDPEVGLLRPLQESVAEEATREAVSYTHLTLPTSDLV